MIEETEGAVEFVQTPVQSSHNNCVFKGEDEKRRLHFGRQSFEVNTENHGRRVNHFQDKRFEVSFTCFTKRVNHLGDNDITLTLLSSHYDYLLVSTCYRSCF